MIAYTTRQRTREIGIRVALGARQADVFRLVVGQGLRLTLAGLLIGLALSLTLTRFLQSQLFGLAASDSVTFIGVAVLLCTVALAATLHSRAAGSKVDPVQALRKE